MSDGVVNGGTKNKSTRSNSITGNEEVRRNFIIQFCLPV